MAGATYGQGFLELTPKLVDGFGRMVEGQLSSVGRKMSAVGDKLTTRLTLPLLAAGAAAFKMGSDLNESISQVGQVFGDEAAGIISASENVEDAFSQADFLAFAGNIGDVAQGLGIAKDESDDMAKAVLSLSQDLSSFKNVPVEQAVQAISSALTGERESLKSLGIVINDTIVKQKAMELGLYSGTGALDQQAQAQATMALITERSANAIGDFDRTSEGAANKTRILAANFKDTAAQLGTNLLPIGQKLLAWANKVTTRFAALSPTAQKVILAFAGVAAAVGPILSIGGRLITNFGKVAGAFQKLSAVLSANPYVLLIAATVAVVVLIVKNWDKIKAFLAAAWNAIKSAASAAWNFITAAVKKAVDFLVTLFLNFTLPGLLIKHWDSIRAGVSAVVEWIKNAWDGVVDFFKGIPGQLLQVGKDIVAGLWRGIQAAWDGLVQGIKDKLSFLPGFIKKFLGISSPSKLFAKLGMQTMAGFRVGLDEGWRQVEASWRSRSLGAVTAVSRVAVTAPLMAGAGGVTVSGNNFYGLPEQMARDVSLVAGREVARRAV